MTNSRLQSVRFGFYNKIETDNVKYFYIAYDSVCPGGLGNSVERLKKTKHMNVTRVNIKSCALHRERRNRSTKEFNDFFFFF